MDRFNLLIRKLRQKTLEAAIADGSINRKYDTVIQCAIERAAEVAVEGGAGAALEEEPEKGSGSSNVIVQVLAGLTTTLSMIPESLAFTFVAGVPPVVGLHAAATMAFVTAIFGSQHGVISGAASCAASACFCPDRSAPPLL